MTPIKNAMTEALRPATTTATSVDATSWRPKLEEYDASIKAAADACAQFIAEMEAMQTPRWLTMNGEAGCGKTMLARQTFLRSIPSNPGSSSLWVDPNQMQDKAKRRPNCVWLDATEMSERMKAGEYDLPEYLADDFIVVLDDLGAARDKTTFIADAVYRLCQQRREKWTIFTTNLTMAEVAERVDERVASRLIRDRNVQVRITAGDFALKRKGLNLKPAATATPSEETYPQPSGWKEWLKATYPDESWAESACVYQWGCMPLSWRAKISREMGAE